MLRDINHTYTACHHCISLWHSKNRNIQPVKPRTCKDLKEISGELVGWDPSPKQQARYFFQISARTCSWLYLIPFIVFRLIQWVKFLNFNGK